MVVQYWQIARSSGPYSELYEHNPQPPFLYPSGLFQYYALIYTYVLLVFTFPQYFLIIILYALLVFHTSCMHYKR
jgi:hypothetical protein